MAHCVRAGCKSSQTKYVLRDSKGFGGRPFCSVSYEFYSYFVPAKKGTPPLSISHPELANESFGWDPSKITKGMHLTLEWRCKKNHTWVASLAHRTKPTRPSGCPYCTNRKILEGFNDLATLFPEIASSADGWDPKAVLAGSVKILTWKCGKNHKWRASVTQRTRGGYRGHGTSCPYCSGNKVLPGFNDLQTTHPEIAAQANGWDPSTISAGSSKSASWKCKQNHIWNALIVSRTRERAADCPYCTNRKLLKGFNDLQTTHPAIAAEADGWDPTTVTRGMDKPRKWKCSVGHKWKTDVIVRTRGSGCPSCSPTGYDPHAPGYLYLLEHTDWEMFQIGITNDIDTRMYAHGLLGWNCVEYRGPLDAILCREWESSILRMLKAKGADLSNSKIAGKFDGYSEAWSKSTFEAKSIKELMRLTEEFEEGR
jgi:hypothetical protein